MEKESIGKIEGEYYLQGAHEMASGFLLKEGGEFQFFFSYGALDRFGSGRWELKNDRLILHALTSPKPGFKLVEANSVANDFVTIKISEENPVLISHVFCSLENENPESWKQTDKTGEVKFPIQPVESIYLLLQFCPEKITTVPVTQKDQNEFIFRMDHSLMEVHLDQFVLQVGKDQISGGHPLMEGNSFVYARS